MLKSKKANDMYYSVSPIYEQCEIMKAIFEAIGNEADMSQELLNDILKQLFPQTATWGLIFWEQRLKLTINLNEDIRIRRAKVLSKLQSTHKIINPKQMALILSNYTKANIDIIEDVAPYTFEIDLISREGFPDDLKEMYKEVKRIKPSHLAVKYNMKSITKNNVYYASTCITGQKVTVYPWRTKKLSSKTEISIAGPILRNAQTTRVYPKRSDE